MRILITGSRDWDNDIAIAMALRDGFPDGGRHTLVSGACPTGADRMCEDEAALLGWDIERHPADWRRYGKRAGFIRNNHMALLGADICYAFIKNRSKGATMMVRLAVQQGIPTHILRED